jgi:hypothetical protein
MLLDRLVNDYSVVVDSFEVELDNSCHFTNIETAYEGGLVWKNPQQIVYSPIFGEELESEDPLVRDISVWEITKTIAFILNDVSIHIWVGLREVVTHIYANIEIYPAYCNLDPPNCASNKASISEQTVEIFNLPKTNPTLNIPMHVHKPVTATAYNKYPVIILIPSRLIAGQSFDAVNTLTGIPDAQRFTSNGFITVHFDVEGRGALSTKIEDFNGYNHQLSLKLVIEKILTLPYVDITNIGILSFGFGNVMALGALARYDLPIKYLIDFEGAVNKDDISGCDGTYGIFNHDCEDTEWWLEREALNFIGDIKCRYLRVQYETNKLSFYDSVMALVNGAVDGESEWVRINSKENKENKHYLLHEYPLWLDERNYSFLIDINYMCEMAYMPSLYIEDPAVLVTDDDTIICDTFDKLAITERLCSSKNHRRDSMLRTFIDAVMFRGFADEWGNCPFMGDLAYLCQRRGYDVNIKTYHQDTRNRIKANINTMLLNTEKRLNTNVVSLNFDDEYQQLDGSFRKLKKYRTNIAVFKPLKYQLRMSPPLSTIINTPVTQDTKLISIYRARFTYNFLEFPVIREQRTESLNFIFSYSRNHISPPADITVSIVPENSISGTQFPLLDMQMFLHLSYKLPLCLYVYPSTATHVALLLDDINIDYPIGTFGWAMKQRIQFIFPNPTANTGYYNYFMVFKMRIPTVFGESVFGDDFGFTEYVERFPLQINVFT